MSANVTQDQSRDLNFFVPIIHNFLNKSGVFNQNFLEPFPKGSEGLGFLMRKFIHDVLKIILKLRWRILTNFMSE